MNARSIKGRLVRTLITNGYTILDLNYTKKRTKRFLSMYSQKEFDDFKKEKSFGLMIMHYLWQSKELCQKEIG